MAVLDNPNPIARHSETILNKRVVGDRIFMIDPMDHPWLDAYGLDSARGKFDLRENDLTIEWIEDQYRTLTGTLSATVATAATGITVSDASVFKIGDVLQAPGGEFLRVNSRDLTNNTLSVTKAWWGSSDATIATGTLTIVSENQIDNTAQVDGPVMGFTTAANQVMILRDAMTVTNIGNKISRYGVTDYFQYQLDKKLPELMRALERAVFQSPAGSVGSLTAAPYMKGLLGFITTNTFSTTQANMTLGNIETNIILPMQNAGSKANEIWCNHKWLQTIKNIYDTSLFLRVERTEGAVGMKPIKMLDTPWGDFRIRESRWCSTAEVFFVDSAKIGMYELEPFYTYDLPPGNYQAEGIEGAYSLVLANELAHGRLHYTA